jgi:ActR/RegA family two-component response regulator/DNA-binding transcriptional ArsR family regulator
VSNPFPSFEGESHPPRLLFEEARTEKQIFLPVHLAVIVRLLVVDDDAVFRDELGELLTQDGHQVVTSPSVPKALAELERQDFEVIFTDLKMPRQSGLELLKEVRHRWPRTMVVMITGFATVDTAVAAMKEGAFDYIRKPFQLAQVQQTLKLVEQELRFQGPDTSPPNLDGLIQRWIRDEHREVLLLTDRSVAPRPHLTSFPLDAKDLSRIRDVVDSTLRENARVGILLESADELLLHHSRADVLAFVEDLRRRVQGHGALVVTYDPRRTASGDVIDLRAALVAPETRTTLEALANPIRRAVLQRAARGPCSFMEAMHAAGLEDSPKLSFHLRKLVDDGLLLHLEEEYKLSPQGREAVRLLAELDSIPSAAASGNAVIPSVAGT